MMAGTDGWIIDAPAATAYAVLPVGVETINPSPYSFEDYLNLRSLAEKTAVDVHRATRRQTRVARRS
jgi:hypothetical protein